MTFQPREDWSKRAYNADYELSEYTRNDATTHLLSTTDPAKKGRRSKRWKRTILLNTCLAFVVFLINLALSIIAIVKGTRRTEDDTSTIYSGDCKKTEQYNLIAHLIINVLSTILLAASNYGMQCLLAPTRKEVDQAHDKNMSLDIGILSMKNLGDISGKRVIYWLILALSSIPLHFCFNSVVFASIEANDYTVFSAYEEMLSPSWSGSVFGLRNPNTVANSMYAEAIAGRLQKLENQDCINTFASTYQTTHKHVILVTQRNASAPPPGPYTTELEVFQKQPEGCEADPYAWICGSPFGSTCPAQGDSRCSDSFKEINPSTWRPLQASVEYCLAEIIQPNCQLRFIPRLAWVVIAFNIAKAIILFLTWWTLQEQPLLTVGDAVSSFLKRQDSKTNNIEWFEKHQVEEWQMIPTVRIADRESLTSRPTKLRREHWSRAVSKSRWIGTFVLFFLLVGIAAGLLIYGLTTYQSQVRSLILSKFSTTDPRTFIQGWGVKTVIENVLVSNTPQVLLSLIYLLYNNLFTGMMLGVEWNDFASERKGLRVSETPTGSQRSTYFLQLPYRWALPLMLLSAALHWLCSQSIYLVSISTVPNNPSIEPASELVTCGFSPPAILVTLSVGVIMMMVALLVGRKRYANIMPIAGSSSLAISAACHPPTHEDGQEAAFLPVQWGRIEVDDRNGNSTEKFSFSSLEVYPVIR